MFPFSIFISLFSIRSSNRNYWGKSKIIIIVESQWILQKLVWNRQTFWRYFTNVGFKKELGWLVGWKMTPSLSPHRFVDPEINNPGTSKRRTATVRPAGRPRRRLGQARASPGLRSSCIGGMPADTTIWDRLTPDHENRQILEHYANNIWQPH